MATSDDLSVILLEQDRLISVKMNAVVISSGAERDAIFDDFNADAQEQELKTVLGVLQSVPTIVAGDGDSRSTVSDFTFADVCLSACRELEAMRADEELFF